jgi:hypothetical protein
MACILAEEKRRPSYEDRRNIPLMLRNHLAARPPLSEGPPASGDTFIPQTPPPLNPGSRNCPCLGPELGDVATLLTFSLPAPVVARLTAVQARIAGLAREAVRLADPLPAYALLRSLLGVGPTVAAILLAELGDITWDHEVQPAPEARRPGHRPNRVRAVGGHRADLPVWEAAPAPGLGGVAEWAAVRSGPRPGGGGGLGPPRLASEAPAGGVRPARA